MQPRSLALFCARGYGQATSHFGTCGFRPTFAALMPIDGLPGDEITGCRIILYQVHTDTFEEPSNASDGVAHHPSFIICGEVGAG